MASLVRVTAATGAVVSLPEVRAHLNEPEHDADLSIAGYIFAAQNWVAEAIGRPLLDETWEYRLDRFPYDWDPGIRIPLPVRSITSITYLDVDGLEQALSSGSPGTVVLVGDTVSLPYGQQWPTTRREAGAVTVTFVSGFGPNAAYVPEAVRQAVLLLAGRFFLQRESVLESGWFESSLVDQMIRPYRWRLVEAV